MPRPRIRPEDRQRAVKACIPCKVAKKRCDASMPCAGCVKRGCPLLCLYQDIRHTVNSRRASQISSRGSDILATDAHDYFDQNSHVFQGLDGSSNQNSHQAQNPIFEMPESEVVLVANADVGHLIDGLNVTDEANGFEIISQDDTLIPSPAETDSLPKSRLMLNAKGEKMHVGNAAALAFLQFLRQILCHYIGPSQFTENSRGNVMLEAQTPCGDLAEDGLNMEQKEVLVESFFLATSGILDFYSKYEMTQLLVSSHTSANLKPTDEAVVHLALAIGGQCNVMTGPSFQRSQKDFAQGQKLAFQGMLEDPSIKLVHAFLLMAFYLLGSCRRNAAFMYIGVAARAAHALGLHEADPNHSLSVAEQNARLRTWKSLRNLDVMVSSILARPFASSSPTPQPCAELMKSRNRGSSKAIDSNFELCSIIEDVLCHTAQKTHLEIGSTQQLLERLTQWSVSLPSEVRICPIKQTIHISEHQGVVGSIHVACLYYFTVMLLTRPFLIQYLMSKLPNLADQSSANISTTISQVPLNQQKVAEVCIDAAMFMAQICQHSLSADLLLDNMCMLKAWIFGAGLVLGFTMFANVNVSMEMENAFSGVRDVLKKFSPHSPQAEHYYDVLVSFSDAISKRRQHVAQERRRATSQYVNQILVTNFSDQQCATPAPGPEEHTIAELDAGSIEDWWNMEFPFAEGVLDNAPDVLTANWDAFAMQISENFVIDASSTAGTIGI